MNGINFIKQNGGLGRTLAGVTHTSGLIIYGEKGFSTIAIASVEHLEQEGVTSTSNPVLHYHVSEFFRINEGAKLYIQSVATSDGNYTEAKVMQNAANGSIRQFAICDFKTAIGSLSTSAAKLQVIAAEFWDKNIPASFFLSMKVTSADIATLPDLHTLDSENVSVVIGQDGGGRGSYLEQRMSLPSISCIGSVLGAASKANVHESIAWVEKQNLVTSFPYDKSITGGNLLARELDVSALCDGTVLSGFTPAQIEQLDAKGYLFGIKHAGATGTYLNDSYSATSLDSDYAYIENSRTISEAVRNINTVLVPKISSPMYINPDTGQLDATTISGLEALCEDALEKMARARQVSGYSVKINPNQKVLSTSKLEVILKVVPVGTLREINVKIGLTLKKEQ